MAKTKPKRTSRGFPPADSPASKSSAKPAHSGQRPMRWGLIALFLTISLGGSYLAIWMRPRDQGIDRFTFEVLKTYPHDPDAFTQGLVYDDGFLWESTGRYGQSSIRKTDLETGEILQQHDLNEDRFGEGLAILDNQLIQLTWKEGVAIVYDRDLNEVKEFSYEGEGWGLATNGTDLIFSDGTNVIKFLDPKTFEERRSIRVRRPGGMRVGRLNELEYFEPSGRIYANSYMTDTIYEIHPETGDVTKVIDLSGLWPVRDRPVDGLLNGIAINPKTEKLLVTGKLCPKIWELRLFPQAQ
jgi:glutamine cyclotransferase